MSISMTRWFDLLRWAMLMGVMTWTASSVARDSTFCERTF